MKSRFGITPRLLFLVLLPLLVLGGFQISELTSRRQESQEASVLGANVRFGVTATDLIHELQKERGLSSGFIGNSDATPFDLVAEQRLLADEARLAFDEALETLDSEKLEALEPAVARLDALAAHRVRIEQEQVTVAETLAPYTEAIGATLDQLSALDFSVDDGPLTRKLVALRSLSQAKEFTGLERGFGNGIVARGAFETADEKARYIGLRELSTESLDQFRNNASAGLTAELDSSLEPLSEVTDPFRNELTVAEVGQDLSFEAGVWFPAMTEQIDAMRAVEVEASVDIIANAEDVSSSASSAVRNFFLLAGLFTLLLVGVALWLARSIVSPLRRLIGDVERTANEDLPEAIAEIAAGGEPEELSFETKTDGPAEFVSLTNSMNTLSQAATGLAGEQAQIRRNVSDLFVNLGRRNQSLLNRQLSFIDELEQSEQDEDTLGKLYQLDHLSTRIRRNAESLLVLAGAESPRIWSKPAPIAQVVRAAMSETEDYARIEVDVRDEVLLSGQVVSDVSHLLAELAENATNFSPPNSTVTIAGRKSGKDYVVAVSDEGIGVKPSELERLNALLASPTEGLEVDDSGKLGLQIASRLASRHGIAVQLVPHGVDGLTARVTLPEGLLAGEAGASAGPRNRPADDLTDEPVLVSVGESNGPAGTSDREAEAAPVADRRAGSTAVAEPRNDSHERLSDAVDSVRAEKQVETHIDRRRQYLDPIKGGEDGAQKRPQLAKRVRGSEPDIPSSDLAKGPQATRNPEEVRSMLAGLADGRARADSSDTDTDQETE